VEEQTGITASYCGEKIFLRKNVLTQYTDLLREVDEVERRIHKTEAELRKIIDEGEVTDVVRGGEGGIQHYTITGFPQRDYNRMRILLNTRKSILHSLKSEIEQSINDVQEFINGIENSHDRRIVTMRVIDRMSWRQIAINMGGDNTEEGVRQTYHRLIERSEA
jgi:hypothetical protein